MHELSCWCPGGATNEDLTLPVGGATDEDLTWHIGGVRSALSFSDRSPQGLQNTMFFLDEAVFLAISRLQYATFGSVLSVAMNQVLDCSANLTIPVGQILELYLQCPSS